MRDSADYQKSVFNGKEALQTIASDPIVMNRIKKIAIKGENQDGQSSVRQVISYANDIEFATSVEMLFKILQPIGAAQFSSERDRVSLSKAIPQWLSVQASWDALEMAGQDAMIDYRHLQTL